LGRCDPVEVVDQQPGQQGDDDAQHCIHRMGLESLQAAQATAPGDAGEKHQQQAGGGIGREFVVHRDCIQRERREQAEVEGHRHHVGKSEVQVGQAFDAQQ
jgi:hypothetical protein